MLLFFAAVELWHLGATAQANESGLGVGEQLCARVGDVEIAHGESWPILSRGEKVLSPFSIVRRSGLKVRLGESVLRIE